MSKENITGSEVEKIIDNEKAAAKNLSKTQRQKRRHDLSDPSKISTRLTSVLAEQFPAEVISEKIDELLNATRELKDGTILTDTRSLEAGLKLLLAYTVGKPVERTETLTVNVETTPEQLSAQIESSPALKARLKKLLGED